MELLIPAAMREDIVQQLHREGLRGSRHKGMLDKSVWFVNNLIRTKEMAGHKLGEYTNLNATILRGKMTAKGLLEVRRTLSALGVLKINDSYSNGGARSFSMSYGLDRTFFKGDIIEHRVTNRVVMPKAKVRTKGVDIFLDDVHEHVSRFGIDYGVYQFLSGRYQSGELRPQQYMAHYLRVKEIDFMDYFVTKDDTGRLYTNFSNLPKEMRPFMATRCGRLLHVREVDVSACMAFVLSILMKRDGVTGSDVDAFARLAGEPDFYGRLSEVIGHESEDFKTDFLVVLNEENRQKIKRPVYRKFRKAFPTVAAYTSRVNASDNGNLYRRCASLESHVMIEGVYKRLLASGKAAFSIHDGILTEPEDVELVQRMIKRAFRQETGREPVVKIK